MLLFLKLVSLCLILFFVFTMHTVSMAMIRTNLNGSERGLEKFVENKAINGYQSSRLHSLSTIGGSNAFEYQLLGITNGKSPAAFSSYFRAFF